MTTAVTSWLKRMRFGGGVFKTLGNRPTAKQYRLADNTVGGAHVLNIILLYIHENRLTQSLPPRPDVCVHIIIL